MGDWDRLAREDKKRARLGQYAECADCGETEIRLLQRTRMGAVNGTDILCARCRLIRQGQHPKEAHHLAGRHNDPTTAKIDANDHAVLTDAQQDWPEATLRNPDGSPLLAAAAALRGWIDVLQLMIDRTVGWIPELLEFLDRALRNVWGTNWWEAPEMEGIERWLPKTAT